jgi:hypothetical protein
LTEAEVGLAARVGGVGVGCGWGCRKGGCGERGRDGVRKDVLAEV